MKITLKDNYILQTGDIVHVNNSYWVVKFEEKGFILRNIMDITGLTGYFKTLSELTESIDHKTDKVSKASEYELILRRKKGD